MSNQVVIPFHQQPYRGAPSPVHPLRAKIHSRLSTARDVVRGVIETLSYMGDARVKRPFVSVPSLPGTK
jgi:hypothetical protein